MRFWQSHPRVWVTADTHFGDERARTKFARPFPDVAAMDEAMIRRWNERVGDDDLVLHLGDFAGERDWGKRERQALRTQRERLRGKGIILVRGNLDPCGESWFDELFDEQHDLLTWKGWPGQGKAERRRVVACHYPLRQWQGWPHGALHLYGHVHGGVPEEGRSTDVGVDCWNYGPVELTGLLDSLVARPFATPTDWPRRQALRDAP